MVKGLKRESWDSRNLVLSAFSIFFLLSFSDLETEDKNF